MVCCLSCLQFARTDDYLEYRANMVTVCYITVWKSLRHVFVQICFIPLMILIANLCQQQFLLVCLHNSLERTSLFYCDKGIFRASNHWSPTNNLSVLNLNGSTIKAWIGWTFRSTDFSMGTWLCQIMWFSLKVNCRKHWQAWIWYCVLKWILFELLDDNWLQVSMIDMQVFIF